MTRRSRLAARPRLECLDDRLVLSAVTPAQLDAAYGLNAITFSNGTVKGTGEGQTIAIVDAYVDPTISGDLTAFDKANNLPNPTSTTAPAANSATSTSLPSFSAIPVNGATAVDSGWNTEEALDVEMAHAAAPRANIVLIEAKSASLTDLLAAVKSAEAIPGVSVISMSWGESEFRGQTAYDSIFTTPAGHAGITFVASAGDSGPGAEWPASSPNVVGVGGTTLTLSSTGTILSQAGWSGSGGGASQVESKPSYQASTISGSYRSTPDVVLDANPSTGVVIVSGGQSEQVGGTSLGAPVFSGLIAIADQGLATAGKPSLGSTQTLTDLYQAKAGSFTAIQGATTRTGFGRRGSTTTTPTGLGSPNALTLVASLDGVAAQAVASSTGTTGTGTGGGGTTTTGGGGTTTTTGGGGTTTTTGGGGTTTTTGGGATTGGENHGRGRHGLFGSGSNAWWNSFFTNRFGRI